MRADIKYLFIGLFIGVGTIGLLLSGMLIPPNMVIHHPTTSGTSIIVPPPTISSTTAFSVLPQISTATRLPTETFTFTPTLVYPSKTPTATHTPTLTPTVPSSTATLSGTMMALFDNGYLSQRGPLSQEQQYKVFSSSLKFIRRTTKESYQLGNQINGVGNGSPSNICGPLSIAILQGAGIARSDLNPHTYWLLNPDVTDDRKHLNIAFPPILFENIEYNRKLNEINWDEAPLYPGDFLYTYAGKGGNFEHMLVVNRVDSDGRAYSVTNFNTPDGFIIDEILLYDPADSNAGIFSLWTARPFAKMGSTGFGGIEIWRYHLP